MKYDIITIGAGLGGLFSSALLAQGGKRVLVVEQHRGPGGYCTSFRRDGFTFGIPSVLTGCFHEPLCAPLKSLGFFDELDLVEIDYFAKYVYPDLEIVMPAHDLDGCRRNIEAAFPAGKRAITTFFSDIERLRKGLGGISEGSTSLGSVLSFVGTLPKIISLSRKSFHSYAKRSTDDEKLIAALSMLWSNAGLPSRSIPALTLLMVSGEALGGKSCFPKDGYQAVSDFLAAKVAAFGGEIVYGTSVRRILTRERKAVGVETDGVERFDAEVVISNADTRKTFLELVGRENLPQAFAGKIDKRTPSASCVSLHVGTNLDLSRFDLKYGTVFYYEDREDPNSYFDKAISSTIDLGRDGVVLGMQASSLFSDRLAPRGMHVLHIVLFPVSWSYGNNFCTTNGERGEAYRALKEQLTALLIRKAEKLIPGLSRSVIVAELSTPYTFERYTGATHGALYDSVFSVHQQSERLSPKTAMENLYLTGVKAYGGGGLSSALRGGLNAAKTILGK